MKELKTHWKKLDNPNYLGAYSLMNGEMKSELIVTIEKVVVEDVKNANGTEKLKVAYIVGNKPLILNTTNSKTIEKVVGSPYIEDWKGKQITLFVARVKAFGDTVEALRVRPIAPKQISKPEMKPGHSKWESCKEAVQNKMFTIEDVKKKYSITPKNEKALCNLK